jgi:hypothetical protein
MWFSDRRASQDVIAALRAENSDLRQQVRFLTQKYQDHEKALLDRILALSNPASYAVTHPRPPRKAQEKGNGELTERPKVWFPGVGMVPPPVTPAATSVTLPEVDSEGKNSEGQDD